MILIRCIEMIKVLFVCLGNICRSPMGESIMKKMVAEKGAAADFYIDSAGTMYGAGGSRMYYLAAEKLREYGVPVGNHVSQPVTRSDYRKYDYIICMEKSNVTAVKRICEGDPDNRIHRLLEYDGSDKDIADPWYTRDFETTYQQLTHGIRCFLEYLGY